MDTLALYLEILIERPFVTLLFFVLYFLGAALIVSAIICLIFGPIYFVKCLLARRYRESLTLIILLAPVTYFWFLFYKESVRSLDLAPSKEQLVENIKLNVGDLLFELPVLSLYQDNYQNSSSLIGLISAMSRCAAPGDSECSLRVPSSKLVQQADVITIKFDFFELYHLAEESDYYHLEDLCPKLKKEWAKHVCEKKQPRLHPVSLTFIKYDNLEVLFEPSEVEFIRTELTWPRNTGKLLCGRHIETLGCSAVFPVSKEVLVTWNIAWKSREEQIISDIKVVKLLLKYLLGEKENFQQFSKELVEWRNEPY